MKGCLMILALSGMLCANSLTAPHAAKNYIYADNIFPNGDFSVSAGEYVIGSPVPGAGEGLGSICDAGARLVACEDGENNTVIRAEGTGFSALFKLLPIVSGETYNVSFDYKVDGKTDNIGIAFWCTSLNNRLPEINIFDANQNKGCSFETLENGYTRVSFARTFDADQTYDSAHIWCNVTNGTIYFDNVKVMNSSNENIWSHGDFEGFLDYASSEVSETPDSNGLYGTNAAYGNKSVKISNGGTFGAAIDLTTNDYALDVTFKDETIGETENLNFATLDANGEVIATYKVIENGATLGNDNPSMSRVRFKGSSDVKKVQFEYSGDDITISNISLRAYFEDIFDPEATYYEGNNLIVNGDFEKFEEGLRFTEEQAEGAWGSVVSYDNGGRIVTESGSKRAAIGKHDEADAKPYSSMFVMTPDEIAVGDLVRFKFDVKLTTSDELDTYNEANVCFVGGANQSYYKIDFKKIDLDNPATLITSGVEKRPFAVKAEELDNGYVRFTLDMQVSNDKIQWNSIRWLFTPHAIGDLMYVDNVELRFLSTEAPTTEVHSVTIDSEDLELHIGDEKTVTATINPSDATDKTLTWTSSNESVATVENGKIKAIAEGTAEITVSSSNGKTDSIIVTVLKNEEPPAPSKGGCGGSIIATSIAVSAIAVAAGALGIAYKAKSKKKGNK